jgi:hypothetical protein
MDTKICTWIYDEIDGCYDTECENTFVLFEGGVEDSGLVCCPYCGKPIQEEK